MKQILLDNALESWKMAIRYADWIASGKATLTYRKHFITALHNAVELFCKQLMLNENDHRVAEVRKLLKDGQPAKDFYNSTDLNDYFAQLDSEKMKSFYSIEFSKLEDHIKKDYFEMYYDQLEEQEKKDRKQQVSYAFGILKDLRNNETHFFIDKWTFMTENQFQQLYNFMIVFYDMLHYYKLLPFIGEAFDENRYIAFDRKAIQNFSYKAAVRKCAYVKTLQKEIKDIAFSTSVGDEAYEIAQGILKNCKEYKETDFEELWTYVEMLQMLGLIKYSDEEVDDYNVYRYYTIKL